jgi:hypothetical protein
MPSVEMISAPSGTRTWSRPPTATMRSFSMITTPLAIGALP